EVKEVIRAHLQESALYGGAISGRGPRYCPSVEDKIVKFPDAKRHQVFLEPEGLDTHELYVNGLSTSLPVSVQLEFLRAVPLAERLGLLSAAEWRAATRRFEEEEELLRVARATSITPGAAAAVLADTGTSLGEPERVATVARRPGVSLRALLEAAGVTVTAEAAAVVSAEIELKYDGYLAREREAATRLAELAAFALPADLPYVEFKSLATEARQKLDRIRPTSLAQAARIPGVSPSDLHNLVVETARWRRRVA